MRYFICPICRQELTRNQNSYLCPQRHCFDLSRKGVLNLLRSQKSRHGDDRMMVKARSAFLEQRYYQPLLDVLKKQLRSTARDGCTVLDCGCGECWYTAQLYEDLKQHGIKTDFFGIDVSKEAVSAGASRCRELKLAVATIYDIPLPDGCCDIVLSLFAPSAPSEYLRLLKKEGYFLTAFPMQEHLWELKQAVYEKPYKNEVADLQINGFTLVSQEIVHKEIEIRTNQDILSLFAMTPYYYKTALKDREKLNRLERLKTQIHFCCALYRKN